MEEECVSCWGSPAYGMRDLFQRFTRATLIVRRGIWTIGFRCCTLPGERNASSHCFDAFARPSVAKCVLHCAFDFAVGLFGRCYAEPHSCELLGQGFLLNHSICSTVLVCLQRQSLIDFFSHSYIFVCEIVTDSDADPLASRERRNQSEA